MIAGTHVTHANPSIELWLPLIHANQGYAVCTRARTLLDLRVKDVFDVFAPIPPFHNTCVPFWTYVNDVLNVLYANQGSSKMYTHVFKIYVYFLKKLANKLRSSS
jgi:hypothetical protein